MDLDEVILVIDAQMPIRARRIKYFEDPALKVLHAGQAGSFLYPDEDGLRRDRQMSETRETVDKLKQELQAVRASAAAQGAAKVPSDGQSREPYNPKPEIVGRARGRAARAGASSAGGSQLAFDPVALGLKEADRTNLAAAVQTTRAIIAEYA